MLAPPLPSRARPGAVARWLWWVAALVVAMVVVGGITRLTESGLSITEWKPLSGTLPPLNAAQWEAEFANYRKIPEYQLLNQGMTLAQFKGIFFWEYFHRLLARLVGVAFAVPLAWFWVRGAIPTGYKGRLLAVLALGGLQGAIGWWMVASGLSVRTDVSHIRLSVHLLNALLILAGTVWTALDLRELAADRYARPARMTAIGAVALVVLFVQLLFGAWVAGLNAGLVTDQWPLMNGHFFPADEWSLRAPLDAIVNDPYVVHFIHRWWAWVAVGALILLARAAKRAGHPKVARAIHITFGVQILLGISTVMSGVRIEVAALHQLVGALLVIAATWGAHATGRR
ncbi:MULTISPECIES: COX15/CtaA family protein [unclassified Sphingomonas]|uniref:COX15/CtaA family protein n=1 Tax=unclassified Sphingomonas TaxID=196159 RepID=UPI0006F5A851|nr:MULTISPECIES: COX15/CtaA family protein [unclassified Sphingomonas]KQM26980.1 heme A synthase [Sphingomonas sp. Leaf9]KQM43315.1 heme A synthase [Sphingomonas sp. Leaf11]